MSESKIWKGSDKPKVLIIGHDPRLQKTQTEAEYCFFADYYFKDNIVSKSDIAKFNLAKSLFDCILEITNNKYTIQDFVVTNLCNVFLPNAPQRKTVLIPEDLAKKGLEEIKSIIRNSQIEIIFSMSIQVNYWLQKLGFYSSTNKFIIKAAPKEIGIKSNPQYYEARDSSIFQKICGKKFITQGNIPLYPILHVKNWPLKGRFKERYNNCYNIVQKEFN